MSDFHCFINDLLHDLPDDPIITGAVVGVCFIDPDTGETMMTSGIMDDTTHIEANGLANIIANHAATGGDDDH